MEDNLKLWKSVEKTNPNYTKKAKVGGNSITAISPQYQIMNATEQFGPYGGKWGFKNIELDYSLVNKEFKKDITEGKWPNVKVVGSEMRGIGLVVFKATFFYPEGEFVALNSISLFMDNAMSKVDDNFAKKVETDSLTKCLSKLGFNADIFLGKFDDQRYLDEVTEEFKEQTPKQKLTEKDLTTLSDPKAKEHIQWYLDNTEMSDAQRKVLIGLQSVKTEVKKETPAPKKAKKILTFERFNDALEALKNGKTTADEINEFLLTEPQQKLLTEAIILALK